MSSPSEGPPSGGGGGTGAPTAPAPVQTTPSTAPSSAASSTSTGGSGGGGLGHSAPLRTLLSPTSGMALVHGSGVATATSTAAAATAAPSGGQQQGQQQQQQQMQAHPFPAVQQQRGQATVPSPYQQQPVQQQQPARPTVAAIPPPPPPTPIQRQAQPDVTPQPQRQPQFGGGGGGPPATPGIAGAGTATAATPAPAEAVAARHAVMTPAPPVAPPPPPTTMATTAAATTPTTTTAAAPASAPLPISAVRQIQQSQQQLSQSQLQRGQSVQQQQSQSQQQRTMRQPAQPQPPPPTMWAAESNAAANSLEADVEAFLSAGGGGGGPSPAAITTHEIHHPFEGYRNVMNAARRRAWGDVVQLTGDLLGNPASPYQPFYSALLQSGSGRGAEDAASAAGASSSSRGASPDLAAAAYGDARLPTEACEVVSLRFHALLKLRRYADLGREVEMLNLLPPPPSGGVDSGGTRRKDTLPSWVPYGLKILAAQTLQYTDKPQKCFDTLYTMREELSPGGADDDDDTAGRERMRWIGRVDAALSNAFMRQKEWRLALSALDDLIDVLPRCVGWEVDSWLEAERSTEDDETRLFISPGEMAKASSAPPTSSKGASAEHRKTLVAVLLSAARIDVLSRQGRVLLQVGALPEADVVFELAKSEIASLELVSKLAPPRSSGGAVGATASDMLRGSILVRQAPTQLVVNDGLASFAKERYDAAMDRFQEAVQLQRNEKGGVLGKLPLAAATGVNHVDSCIHPGVGVDAEDCLVAQCLNNMALCALYSCQMLKAVNLIESLIREDPTVFLTEVLAFNLCTLYELGSDNALSGRKKRMVQLIAKKFSLHDIGTESFRIN